MFSALWRNSVVIVEQLNQIPPFTCDNPKIILVTQIVIITIYYNYSHHPLSCEWFWFGLKRFLDYQLQAEIFCRSLVIRTECLSTIRGLTGPKSSQETGSLEWNKIFKNISHRWLKYPSDCIISTAMKVILGLYSIGNKREDRRQTNRKR